MADLVDAGSMQLRVAERFALRHGFGRREQVDADGPVGQVVIEFRGDSMETRPEIEAVLAKPLHAVAAFNRVGRPPQLSVVWFDWDGTTFRLSTLRTRLKYRLFTRDPQLSLLINDHETLTYVAAVGEAHEEGGHAELAKRLFARYRPGQEPGDSPADPDRVVLALTPERLTLGS